MHAANGVTLEGHKDIPGLRAGTGGEGAKFLDGGADRPEEPRRLASKRHWDALRRDVKPI